MRRLGLVLILLITMSLILIGADYTRDPDAENYFEDVQEEGDVNVYVHQWLDVEFTQATENNYENIDKKFHIYDYGVEYTKEPDTPNPNPVGKLMITSNADVKIKIVGFYLNESEWIYNDEFVEKKWRLYILTGQYIPSDRWANFGEELTLSQTPGTENRYAVGMKLIARKGLPAGHYTLTFKIILNPTVTF